MKTIGETIKEARKKKKFSREKLENETKIKASFVEKIESGKWDELPEYPVVAGFVKKIAKALDLNEEHALALLRRDYPPKTLPINPKPDAEQKFTWSPRLTFILGVLVVVIVILVYLSSQYLNFIKPPEITVDMPVDGQIVTEDVLKVSGVTDPEAVLTVNNQPVIVEEDGSFETDVEVSEGTEEIVVVAKSRSGKESIVRRKIKPELNR